jgi:hypothetical protein
VTTQELVERLRDAGLNLGHEAMNENPWEPKIPPEQAVFFQAADRLSEMDAEIKRLREIASNAARATRFVQLVASQRPSKQAREWYIGEFGDEGEPDFEGGYDALIQDARNIFNDTARAALEHQQQQKGEKL